MDEYDEQAMITDAEIRWQPWSLQIEKWKQSTSAQIATVEDFSMIPGSDLVFAKYNEVRDKLAAYLYDGEEVFEGIARALLDTAREYMILEGYAQEAVQDVENMMDAL